jgi:prevent-host-death family protein
VPEVNWQVQEAKQRFSELVRRTLEEGPQVVTRHGEEVVVIVAADEYRRSQEARTSFKEFLMSSPSFDDLQLDRSTDPPREISFDD